MNQSENEDTAELPSEDFDMMFFDKAKYVSDELLQTIFAKILANEINNPGSISPRALNTLSCLSSAQLKGFKFLCGTIFDGGVIIVPTRDNGFIVNNIIPGLDYNYFFNYDMIQEFLDRDTFFNERFVGPKGIQPNCSFGFLVGKRLMYIRNSTSKNILLKSFTLKPPFNELYRLLKIEINTDYLVELKKRLEDIGFIVGYVE